MVETSIKAIRLSNLGPLADSQRVGRYVRQDIRDWNALSQSAPCQFDITVVDLTTPILHQRLYTTQKRVFYVALSTL